MTEPMTDLTVQILFLELTSGGVQTQNLQGGWVVQKFDIWRPLRMQKPRLIQSLNKSILIWNYRRRKTVIKNSNFQDVANMLKEMLLDDNEFNSVLRPQAKLKSLSAYTRVGGEFFILYSKSYTY